MNTKTPSSPNSVQNSSPDASNRFSAFAMRKRMTNTHSERRRESGYENTHASALSTTPKAIAPIIMIEKTQLPPPITGCSIPLVAVLVLQCLLVVFAFVALVLMTSLMMDNATRKLVRQSVSSDLQYARARILAPIESYEHTAVSMRQSYIYLSKAIGRDICADSPSFMDSKYFFIAATVAARLNPRVSYLYSLRRSDTRLHPIEGLPDVVECDVTPDQIAVINNASRLTNRPVELEDCENLDSIPYSLTSRDFYYEGYVTSALSRTHVAWEPYLYVDVVYNTTDLYLSGYVPMKVNRTFANGTFQIYEPNLFEPESDEDVVSAVSISTMGIDVGLNQFFDLMKGITPDSEGAHTSMYDLTAGVLVCTSEPMQLFNADLGMWPAGATSSARLNAAFAEARPAFAEGASAATYSTIGDEAELLEEVAVQYKGSNVVSTISVRTSSGINFAIVQSTPVAHYLGPVTRLRNIMVVVGVVAAVAVVAVCLVVGFAIRSPLRRVEANMQLAAVMKNDRVEATTSILTEINELCGTFGRMNAKLLQARDFMPQAMLQDSTTAGGDESDEGDLRHSQTIQVSQGDDGISKPSLSVSHTESALDAASTAITSQATRGLAPIVTATSLLSLKRVTILAINARGFHSAVNVTVPTSIVTPAAELTSLVNGVCTACRGVIDSFHGDHFVLSFNAAKSNAQGPQSAMRAALGIVHGAAGALTFYMGASTGRACVGHLGTTGLKRLSIVGRAYSRALALEGVCRRVRKHMSSDDIQPVECITDRALAVEVGHSHTLQVLGRVEGGPFSDSAVVKEPDISSTLDSDVIYAVRDPVSMGDLAQGNKVGDEWLYEVSRLSSMDPVLTAVNRAMVDFVRNASSGGAGVHLMSADALITANSSDASSHGAARQELHSALNRIAELPSTGSWGRVALEYARKVADGQGFEYEI